MPQHKSKVNSYLGLSVHSISSATILASLVHMALEILVSKGCQYFNPCLKHIPALYARHVWLAGVALRLAVTRFWRDRRLHNNLTFIYSSCPQLEHPSIKIKDSQVVALFQVLHQHRKEAYEKHRRPIAHLESFVGAFMSIFLHMIPAPPTICTRYPHGTTRKWN